ncbi:hypothetical protein F2Q69_00020794 [Brassica cretica]|uniref:Uncharacterized protein n=1 Tax=Brassica cretica TaxID=69181 RepID=A0A8S9Q7U6_BRACR|nr:hypothetical protein F2Q69_00020794 [Brassica cretica]
MELKGAQASKKLNALRGRPSPRKRGSGNLRKYNSHAIQRIEGWRPLVSTPVKNWSLTITSRYAFLACLSSFMVRYSGVLGVEEQHQSIPNLVVKLYCGDDTVGEVLRKNSSTPG